MIRSFLFFTLLLTVISCGKSPFTEKDLNPSNALKDIISQRSSLINLGEDYKVEVSFISTPLVYENGSALVSFFDKSGNPVDPALRFDAKLWMPNHGHGSFKINIERIGRGYFKLTDVFFTMPGLWDLHLNLVNDAYEIVEEAKWPIKL